MARSSLNMSYGLSLIVCISWSVRFGITLIFTERLKVYFFPQVTVGCGATSSENCTYFEVTGAIAGACRMNICKQNNICQVG